MMRWRNGIENFIHCEMADTRTQSKSTTFRGEEEEEQKKYKNFSEKKK